MNYLGINLSIDSIIESAKFNIQANQKVALVGVNGAGKSTLLSSFLGLNELKKTGEIIFKNKNILELKTSEIAKLGIGIINQQSIPIKNLKLRSVLEAINPDKKSEIDNLAKKLQITHLLDRDINVGYSGGEMRRTELAQIMIQNPELVLIDELDSGVDIDSRKIIYQTLNNWLKNKTAIIVSHDFEIYQTLAIDKLLVVKNKQIIEQDLAYLGRVKERGYE